MKKAVLVALGLMILFAGNTAASNLFPEEEPVISLQDRGRKEKNGECNQAVPNPGSVVLLGTGLLILVGIRRRIPT